MAFVGDVSGPCGHQSRQGSDHKCHTATTDRVAILALQQENPYAHVESQLTDLKPCKAICEAF